MIPVQLAIFEFLGTTEMLVIAVVALIIFGPRKLPELGKSLGKSLAEFKRASNELKNTLDEEIRLEERRTANLEEERRNAERQAAPVHTADTLQTDVPPATGTDDHLGSVPRQNGTA